MAQQAGISSPCHIAPGADLLFNTGQGGVATYANNIINLAAAGADVIVDDLMYPTEPMFQDGVVAQRGELAAGAQASSLSGWFSRTSALRRASSTCV